MQQKSLLTLSCAIAAVGLSMAPWRSYAHESPPGPSHMVNAIIGSTVCAEPPNRQYSICAVVTLQRDQPFQDAAYYLLRDETLHRITSTPDNSVGTFAGMGFINEGRFFWIGWADEGHPYFDIYESHAFMESPEARSLFQVALYGLEHVDSVQPDGTVVVAINREIVPGTKCLAPALTSDISDPGNCHIVFVPEER